MSLEIKSGRAVAKWVIIGILVTIMVIFVIKTAIWEHQYYSEKEGSERAIAMDMGDELVEVAPTEDEVAEYTVPADRPRYLSIDRLKIKNARVLPMGINSAGELSTPNNIFDVGWYYDSGKPGQGGTLLIDGHNGGPHVQGVFKDLPALGEGDIIVIERGDGAIFRYSVVESMAVSLSDSNDYMATAIKTPMAGKESITLISCTGEWSQAQGTYLSRQFVRGILVE
ncbi:MAG: class F sortase [Candidatus Saccharibacteria bacterium]|nr:class F sortase [Candidatus Saccharibacteria bacterium]